MEKHKRKVRLQPHMRKWRCHVTLLAGKQGMEQELMPFAWMKMRVKDIKMVEQAGGLEAKMVGLGSELILIRRVVLTTVVNGIKQIVNTRQTATERSLPSTVPAT